MPEPDYRKLATDYLVFAADQDEKTGNLTLSADGFRQASLVYAVLAVADELRQVHEEVSRVATYLTGPHGSDVGTSLYYINDWLKDIAEKS